MSSYAQTVYHHTLALTQIAAYDFKDSPFTKKLSSY